MGLLSEDVCAYLFYARCSRYRVAGTRIFTCILNHQQNNKFVFHIHLLESMRAKR